MSSCNPTSNANLSIEDREVERQQRYYRKKITCISSFSRAWFLFCYKPSASYYRTLYHFLNNPNHSILKHQDFNCLLMRTALELRLMFWNNVVSLRLCQLFSEKQGEQCWQEQNDFHWSLISKILMGLLGSFEPGSSRKGLKMARFLSEIYARFCLLVHSISGLCSNCQPDGSCGNNVGYVMWTTIPLGKEMQSHEPI